ncbi:hypothetical protein SAMN05518849_11424 [Sphingobium sp. AP50]|uniref:hypothetical protein n=1 Tax=Sphingobium sp. AP50 TaxID=1884369 RepID=UPI0008AE7F95|nr:hypothetical protein [Sphingobium sp. AP50]SEJ80480.1 hypothetical protein SAMN05518849_11424 [Sphingobium sp. AP50]
MADITLNRILEERARDLALVVGNGMNRYANASITNSWDHLLLKIARHCAPQISRVPAGTTLTEFYDVLELRSRAKIGDLQAEFCEEMGGWRPYRHHDMIMGWARRNDCPVLTTNFDEVLSKAASASFQRPENPKFTSFYPWECYFAPDLIDDPCEAFGIWHINGMARYKLSIRLGLTHYMGSVQRARGWMHRAGEENLFKAKNKRDWRGAGTWMHVAFNRPLLIFGLALEENEVFLRWLLIERAKYFRKFPQRRQDAWYIYVDDPKDERQAGKLFFLEAVGITPVRAASFDAIYTNPQWV